MIAETANEAQLEITFRTERRQDVMAGSSNPADGEVALPVARGYTKIMS